LLFHPVNKLCLEFITRLWLIGVIDLQDAIDAMFLKPYTPSPFAMK
jgi:hypothetical protein